MSEMTDSEKLRNIALWIEDRALDVNGWYSASQELRTIADRLEQPAPSIVTREYSISQRNGMVWLENRSGEGMECNKEELDRLLGEFFSKNF